MHLKKKKLFLPVAASFKLFSYPDLTDITYITATSRYSFKPCDDRTLSMFEIVHWAEQSDVICVIRHFECKRNSMGKACCAAGCSNRFIKGSGVHFIVFLMQDERRKSQWIAAVGRKDWTPNSTRGYIVYT